MDSAEPSHNFTVSGRRRNATKTGKNRSESLCAGLWVPCRVFKPWFGAALGPNPIRNRRFPAGILKFFRPCRVDCFIRRAGAIVGNGGQTNAITWSVSRIPDLPCYAIVLPGRKSRFRAGCLANSSRAPLKIGPPAGLRPILKFSCLQSGRKAARKPDFRLGSAIA